MWLIVFYIGKYLVRNLVFKSLYSGRTLTFDRHELGVQLLHGYSHKVLIFYCLYWKPRTLVLCLWSSVKNFLQNFSISRSYPLTEPILYFSIAKIYLQAACPFLIIIEYLYLLFLLPNLFFSYVAYFVFHWYSVNFISTLYQRVLFFFYLSFLFAWFKF